MNLKSVALNSDLFTDILTYKIKYSKTPFRHLMDIIINKVNLPKVNRIKERSRITKSVDLNMIENRFKNLNLNCIFTKSHLNLDNHLKDLYYNVDMLNGESLCVYEGLSKTTALKVNGPVFGIQKIASYPSLKEADTELTSAMQKLACYPYPKDTDTALSISPKGSGCALTSINYINIYNTVFNSIKYKNSSGIRLEVKGRLTKRYRADRALFVLKWKGGLRNIDSSYKGLSSVNFRGFVNSNVEYSINTSIRRIGSFAVKGWVSGQ